MNRAKAAVSASPARRKVQALLLALAWGLLISPTAAHPLGNNTVNRQAGLKISAGQLRVRYLMDVAEIPTLLEAQKADVDRSGTVSQQEWDAYSKQWAQRRLSQLHVELNGRPVALQLQSQHLWLQPGAANLSILRLEANYAATLSGYEKRAALHYRDDYKPELPGWKEIWLSADSGAAITRSTASTQDRSSGLTRYDAYRAAPPNELTADATLAFTVPVAQAPDEALQDNPLQPSPRAVQPTDMAVREGQSSVAPASMLHLVLAFFILGVHHIATGWDHLVFLLGLLLLVKSLPQLLKTVTAFTIAHSFTLALAANHWVTPPGSWVEPGIALTIAYVGLLNLAWRHSRHGAWLAFGFGLVHGFGFAGALAQTLAEQRPTSHYWLVSLLSFNLGIEAFQLLLVCLIVPMLRLAASHAWFGTVRQLASFGVLSAGVVWFLLRIVP